MIVKLLRRTLSAAKKGAKAAPKEKPQSAKPEEAEKETYDPWFDDIQKAVKDDLLLMTKVSNEDIKPHTAPHFPPFLYHPIIAVDQQYYYPKLYSIQFDNVHQNLKQQRDKDLENYPLISNDGYLINLGLVITRSPIFLNFQQKDLEYSYKKYSFFESCGMTVKAHKDLVTTHEGETQKKLISQAEEMRIKQIRDLTRRLQPGFKVDDAEYTPNSKHFLFVNPKCVDPQRLEAFGAYRTFLLVKSKQNKKWQFPFLQMHGSFSFTYFKKKIIEQYFQQSLQCEELSLTPSHLDVENFENTQKTLKVRPYEEDWWDMEIQRAQGLFPELPMEKVEQWLLDKRSLKKPEQREIQEIKGQKTLYFQVEHQSGVPKINKDLIEDFAWVPRIKLNEYLEKKEWEKHIHSLKMV